MAPRIGGLDDELLLQPIALHQPELGLKPLLPFFGTHRLRHNVVRVRQGPDEHFLSTVHLPARCVRATSSQ